MQIKEEDEESLSISSWLFCLFVWIDVLRHNQQQRSCRDAAYILWDFYPTL